MNWDLILLLIFFVILYSIYFIFKKKFHAQGIFIMYRTKLGLKLMNWLAKKCPRFLNIISYVGIFIGYLGMIAMVYFLGKGVFDLLMTPAAPPLVAPVLPGIEIAPGIPVLSFWHWILGILIIATIHEFAHGVYARLHKIKIKSSGFAFLGPLLAAFVEPDEKQMMKKSKKKQLSVLMAGPFSNILSGFLFLGMFVLLGVLVLSGLEADGIKIVQVQEGMPLEIAGLEGGEIIKNIDGVDIVDPNSVGEIITSKPPGEMIIFANGEENWEVESIGHPENESVAYFGFSYAPNFGDLGFGVKVGVWFIELFFWLWVISFGVALFNLLPLGPVDGGRMFYLAMLHFTKDKNKANKIWRGVSFFVLLLILVNLWPWLTKLVSWIFGL